MGQDSNSLLKGSQVSYAPKQSKMLTPPDPGSLQAPSFFLED